MERCPKSIKITWNRIFLNAMLSGAPRTILHKIFTCAMLSQEHYENVEQGFSDTMLSEASCEHSIGF